MTGVEDLGLSDEIHEFLEKYGKREAGDPDSWSSPDAHELEAAAHAITAGRSYKVNSSWESGGYKPYTDQEGRKKHDELVRKINTYRGRRVTP